MVLASSLTPEGEKYLLRIGRATPVDLRPEFPPDAAVDDEVDRAVDDKK